MTRRAPAVLAATLLVAALPWGSAAAAQIGTVTPEQQTLAFSGAFNGEHLLTPAPEVRCVQGACDEHSFTVALGDAFWDGSGGAIEVAIRWAYDGVVDLDLIVTDAGGTEVGRSAAVDSNAESVFLDALPDGIYTATVAPSNTINPDREIESVPYEGLVQVEPYAATGDGTDLLPNLVALPPRNFHIASAANLVPFPENPVVSCYPEETIESDAHPTRCLRFDQAIANTGDGPLELRFAMDGALSPDVEDHRMVQRIYTDDGAFRDRFADSYELHAVHGHVHYRGFGQSFLYPYDWENRARVLDEGGEPVVASVGNKVGFCVIDVMLLDEYWGSTGNGPRTRTFPTCNLPQEFEDGVWMVQGIDVGWADVYGWNLADQYIDVSDVPDGLYEIEQLANPNGSVIEQRLTDNRASTIICLTADAATPVTSDDEAAACTGST